jgi:hypothetical protein
MDGVYPYYKYDDLLYLIRGEMGLGGELFG